MASRVLVVDDEPGMVNILEIVLERAGYSVLTALDGLQAMRVLADEQPDLVILDEMMPGLTGSEVCRRMRQDERLRTIPVLMHTAAVYVQTQTYLETIGANGLLTKPCSAAQIAETVAQVLAQPV